MARHDSWLINWTQYAAARCTIGLVQCFDVEQNLHTAGVVGSWLYRANRSRRERTHANIQRSFPEWDDRRVSEVAEESFRHMIRLFMVDAMVGPRLITPDKWPEYVELGSMKPAIEQLMGGGPAILITGHCGNWELLASLLAVLGYPVHALARPIDNPFINRWLMGMREAHGTRIVTKWGAMPVVQEIIQKGGRVGFIADQNAGDQGLFVPFFGRLASSYKSIALLAMRYELPVIAGHALRTGRGFEYRLDITDVIRPEDWADQPDPVYYITARYNLAIEQMVRAAPEQYLWVHRRWKSRPRHEREGKPLPDRLRRHIEALPWLDTTARERIFELANPPYGNPV